MKIICITPLKHLPGLYQELRTYGTVRYEPEISGTALARRLRRENFDCIFTNPNKQDYKLDRSILAGTTIKVINTASTGLNHIDMGDCEKLGIKVLSLTRDYELIKNLPSTAELAFGLMMALLRQIPVSADSVKAGEWDYERFMGRQVQGLTAGIVGYGRLGYFMAKFCAAFGMNVLVCDPYKTVYGFDQVSLRELAKVSDVISLHVHVSDETRGLISAALIRTMKKRPYIINTSRGELVDERAVIAAVKAGRLAGYGADGIADEFGKRKKSPMIAAARRLPQILLVPHTGGMTWEGQARAYRYAIKKFGKLIF